MQLICTCLLGVISLAAAENELKLEYHGAGWLQVGRIENSFTEGSGNDLNKNWLGNAGGVLTTKAQIDENWDAGFGLGTIMVHLPRGSRGQASKWYPFWVPFVAEARMTYASAGYAKSYGVQLNFGAFDYNYNSDVKNLGLYLMHGYTYPGSLESGFGKIFGFVGKGKIGVATNDFIINMETEEKPFNDISIADVITIKPSKAVEFGFGINFSRLIPMNKKFTSPGADCDPNFLGVYAKGGQDNACFIVEKDSSGKAIDTVLGSLSGTRMMGRVSFDPKSIFGMGSLGSSDLVVYSEVGLIGLKNYPKVYDDILRRIPIMVGINLPGFNFINWSIEAEYYANKNSGDNLAARSGSWVPVVDGPTVDTKRDDWKWSLNASKVIAGNLALSTQFASDHLRMGGTHDSDAGIEAMRTIKDWYWTLKLAYFF